jgi:hypothetical protein
MRLYYILLILFTSILVGCNSGGSDGNTNSSLSFNVSNAESLTLGDKDQTRSLNSSAFSINYDDQMEGMSSAKILDLKIFGNEVFVNVSSTNEDGTSNDISGIYVVQRDNSYLKLPVDSMPINQTESGMILFPDGHIYNPQTQITEKIDTGLSNYYISSASGNFALTSGYIGENPTTQLLDTDSGLRYNVANCNGPDFVALSLTKAIVDDCNSNQLIDMTTGERSQLSQNAPMNGEQKYLGSNNGAYLLGQIGTDHGFEWGVTYSDSNGLMTRVTTGDLGFPASCNNNNCALFSNNDWIVVRSVYAITVYNLNTSEQKTILNNLNVLYIDLHGDDVTYVAETTSGQSVYGKYNVLTDTDNVYPSNNNTQLNYIESYLN